MSNSAAAAAKSTRPGRTDGWLLLSAGDRLTQRQMDRLFDVLETDDPNNEIGAAWGCKERLRMLLAERDPDQVRRRLWDFYQACATADMDETTRLGTPSPLTISSEVRY